MQTMTLDQLIASLTLEQAIECENQTDKLIWVEVNLLDPVGISRRHAEKVDEALCGMYADYWNETTEQATADRLYSN
jgi:hypothetical protein